MVSTILFIDTSIKTKSFCQARLLQYYNGLMSIFKHNDYFISNGIDIVYVDNTISNLDDLPGIKDIIPPNVTCVFKENNIYGQKSNTAGCFEHWVLSKDMWEKYDYIIHFEARQILKSRKFFEEFLRAPVSTFSWCTSTYLLQKAPDSMKQFPGNRPLGMFVNKDRRFRLDLYGRDNSNSLSPWFNDFYTGLFSFRVDAFKKFVENVSLEEIVTPPTTALEKILMVHAYEELPIFRVVDRLNVIRFANYNNCDGIEHY